MPVERGFMSDSVTNLRSPAGTDSCLTPDEDWWSHDESGGAMPPIQ